MTSYPTEKFLSRGGRVEDSTTLPCRRGKPPQSSDSLHQSPYDLPRQIDTRGWHLSQSFEGLLLPPVNQVQGQEVVETRHSLLPRGTHVPCPAEEQPRCLPEGGVTRSEVSVRVPTVRNSEVPLLSPRQVCVRWVEEPPLPGSPDSVDDTLGRTLTSLWVSGFTPSVVPGFPDRV